MPKLKMSEKVKSRVKSSDSCYSAIPPGLSIRIGVTPNINWGLTFSFAPEGALQRGDD